MRTLLPILRRDERGGPLVEFAILAPAILTMMFGVLQVGIQMFSYNALRSVVADTTRYTMIQYQNGVKIDTTAIQGYAGPTAVGPRYNLNSTFDATVTNPTSDIAGMKKFTIVATYTPANPLGFANISALNLSVTRSFYVSAS